MPIAPGTQISHYRLVERVGRGGMGEVWLAEDVQLPRTLAIKFLAAHLAADERAVQRMLREAQATASIDHPAVATIYETGELDESPYLVMQYFEGETLEARLERGAMEIQEVLEIAHEIADALAEVHSLGIVHRDLKPSNVMLTPRGPRILDFGLASMQAAPRLTEHGTALGTPLFMSPEQLRGDRLDNRADLWGLGVLLYNALTGINPFAGPTREASFNRILNERPESPRRLRPGIDAELDHVVMKLLRKQAAHRYQRAEELLVDLDTCLARQATRDAPTEVGPTALAEQAVPRLAVIPFEVMSTEPEDTYLASGLVEDLIVDFTRLQRVHVPTRTEVAPYADRSVPPRTMARELGVEYVLLGSVRRHAQRARISASLVRASDGHTIWADRFDRSIEDIFALQEEVSREIVSALRVALHPEEREILRHAPARDPEAYTLYLKARDLMDRNRESNLRAERLLEDAIRLDPDFALAHAALAHCYILRPARWWAGLEMIPLAERTVQRALELDPDLPDALHVDLIRAVYSAEPGQILPAIERVLAVTPEDENALAWAAWGYLTLKRPEDARALVDHVRGNYQAMLWRHASYLMLEDEEGARRARREFQELLVRRIQRDPEAIHERSLLAGVLARQGRAEAAIAQAERAVALDPKDARAHYNAACAFSILGRADEALEHLRQALSGLDSLVAEWPKSDPDLELVRRHPGWAELFSKAADRGSGGTGAQGDEPG